MTFAGWAVLGVIFICLLLLITTHYSVDMILFGGLAALIISGIITPQQGLSGFSNEGLVTLAILYIVASGLKETGAIQYIVQKILGNAKGVKQVQFRIMLPVMLTSAFINNTTIVASFIPALENWSRHSKIPLSKILIPLSYAAILGGTCTLIGTSTNLILNGLLLATPNVRALGLFEPALIGIPVAIVGFIYLYVFGDKLLPERGSSFEMFKDPREYTIEMLVPAGSILSGKTIEEGRLRQLPGLFLVEILRDDAPIPAVAPSEKLKENDRLIFAGIVDSIVDLQNVPGLILATNQLFKLDAPKSDRKLIEAVVSSSHPLLGNTVKEGQFRNRYNAVILAVSRSGERVKEKIGDITLKTGDTLLLEAHPEFLSQYRNSNDFFLISSVEGIPARKPEKTGLALFILVLMIVLAGTGLLSMLQSSLLAASLMVITRVLNMRNGIQSLNWNVLIAIASSLGLGNALSATGTAHAFSEIIMHVASISPYSALIIIFLGTWILTEVITNSAAAVLVFPVALSLAVSFNVNVIPFVMIIIIAASASFTTPIGYQTNMMIYGPGGYKYTDFIKIGLPLNIIVGIITILLVPLIWEF